MEKVKDYNIYNIIVSVGVWNEEGKFLMVEEGKQHVKGLWNLPSGRLELDETLIDGAKREVLEETGCSIEIIDLCGIFHYQLEKERKTSIRVCFNGKLISEDKNFKLEEDVLSYDWKTEEEIKKLMSQGKLRSKISEIIIQEYFNGTKYPLTALKSLR